MNSYWRFILFLVFALGFVVTAPLVVLYTAGYRYHFESGRVLKTGLLHITSIPKEADVWIDEELQKNKTPTVVKNIFPGAHEILLKKNGYLPWRKHLAVNSNQTTFAEDIVLFADEPLQLLKQRRIFDAATHAASGRLAYLLRESSWIELWIMDGEEEQLLARLPDTPTMHYVLAWSDDATNIILTQTSELQSIMIRVDARTKTVTQLPSKTHIIEPEITQWNDRSVILQSIEQQSIVSFYDHETQLTSPIAYLPAGDYRFFEAPNPFLVVQDQDQHHLYLIDPSNAEPIVASFQAIGWQWHPKHQLLLFHNGYEIEVFDAERLQTQTITRFSEPVKHVMWFPKGDVILFSKNHEVSAIETDPRDRQQTILVNDMDVQQFWTSVDGSMLYVIGSQEDQKGIWKKLLQFD